MIETISSNPHMAVRVMRLASNSRRTAHAARLANAPRCLIEGVRRRQSHPSPALINR